MAPFELALAIVVFQTTRSGRVQDLFLVVVKKSLGETGKRSWAPMLQWRACCVGCQMNEISSFERSDVHIAIWR